MVRWRLGTRRRAALGDKLLDLANYAAAAMVFSQFIGPQPFSWTVVVGGVAAWLVFAAWAVWLIGEG
jgi:hypothetical protein